MKILQIGEGNFLRAFVEDFIEQANSLGLMNAKVYICQPRNNTKVINALKAQNCKYTINLSGLNDGNSLLVHKKIECVADCFDTQTEFDKIEALFCDEDLKLVISNTTEAGICFDENEKATDIPNKNIPARITNLLYKRYKAGKEGVVFLPVELIEDNADTLKQYILQYAALWGYEKEFVDYVKTECSFCNTLVDRIVSGHDDNDKDPCSVNAELYASWIIQADDRCKELINIDWLPAIQWAENLAPYRTRKVRILNGAHTMSVLAAYMSGFSIVRDMVNDETFRKYIDLGLEEIKQTINLPKEELNVFSFDVLERFANPFIDHKLFDISLNSMAKFKTRCLPSIIDYMEINGKAPKILSFAFAALIAFYLKCGTDREYTPNDSKEVLDFYSQADDIRPFDVLSNEAFWGQDLSKNEMLALAVENAFESIKAKGISEAVKEVIG